LAPKVGNAGEADKRKLASDSWIANAGSDGTQDRQVQSAKVQIVKVKPRRFNESARVDTGKMRA